MSIEFPHLSQMNVCVCVSVLHVQWESKTIKRMVFRWPEKAFPSLQSVKI